MKPIVALVCALLPLACIAAPAAATVSHLQVEYRDDPLGIDVTAPRFSWRGESAPGLRGVAQSAYQVTVKDPSGQVVWDTGKVADARSLDISYKGAPLRAGTRYDWTVTAWDTQGGSSSGQAWFETGLMNPSASLEGWEGANWIGGTDADLVLYAPYLAVFNVSYTLTIPSGSERAALVFGANDPRLMDRNKNILQLQNARNQSYLKVELDVGSTPARLNVYRAGYTPTDSADKPVKSFQIRTDVLTEANRHGPHRVSIDDEFGALTFALDGRADFFVPEPAAGPATPPPPGPPRRSGAHVNLNPYGEGGDFLSYGQLCDLGFAVPAGQGASFSDLVVANIRKPGNAVFHEDLTQRPYAGIYERFSDAADSGLRIEKGAYVVRGGKAGAFVVADPSHNAMPMLRTTFTAAAKQLKSARLYVTARGIYEMYLNGKRVGEDYFNPGVTQYDRTHLYQTYDVTRLVSAGDNALGALLGEGWWSGLLSFGTIWNHFGDRQSLLAKLVLTYDDGSRQVVTTNDGTWKYFNGGPIVYSSLYLGEIYDATREPAIEGWSTARYDDRAWHRAVKVSLEHSAFLGGSTDRFARGNDINYDHLALVGQIGEPARVYRVLTARSVKEVRKGVFVYDLGQNIVGVPRVRIEHGEAGRRMTFRVAEMLYPDLPESGANVGMIMTENYRAARSEDQYIMKAGTQTVQPRFTFHGFQYLEITGLDAPLPLSQVEALSISSVHEITAQYETSNRKVNQLWSNLVWSNVDNFLSIPTDCPQRNERMGWSGDISVFSRTATYVSDADPFLARHARALRDTQLSSGKFTDIAPIGGGFGGLLWGSAGITVPWETYQQYGDTELLREHYAAMVKYIDYLATTIDPRTGLSRDAQLGDWLGPQNDKLGPAFLATAYHVFDLDIMTRVARILGHTDDAARFATMHDERKAFFNRTFVTADKKTLGLVGQSPVPDGPLAQEGEFKLADTQTSYAVGLALNVFSDDTVPAMEKNLAATVERENADDQGVMRPKYALMTGFIGTAWINEALSDSGRNDLAYRLLQNSQYPSWLYPIDQGATTIWERLNGYTVENGFGGNNHMNSFNHYSFGAVGQWLMAYSLGIQRGEPGFKSFVLQPEPDPTGQMNWAKGHYDSPYGRIESAWSLENGTLTYTATVPANTTATLYLPARSAQGVQESGKPASKSAGVTFEKYEKGKAVYRLGSGAYHFVSVQ